MRCRIPRVSIGVPVYNGERFIKESLNSLLAQTFEDFELTISDNASNDNTQDICRAYAARDCRIRYLRNETNIGVNRNYNRVFEVSRGEYFKWAAADDVCHPCLIARCVEILDQDPAVVLAYGKTTFIDEAGKKLDLTDPGWDLRSSMPHERMRYVIYSGHWVNSDYGVIRAKELAKTRLFPVYGGGDYRLMGELSLRGKLFEIPECLFFRRIHAAASGQNLGTNWKTKYITGRSRSPGLPLWHLCLDHLITVFRSDLSISQKLHLVGAVLDRMISEKHELWKELALLCKYYATPLSEQRSC
jgi:glycosyltransferase involved in cell wall biosynthesis